MTVLSGGQTALHYELIDGDTDKPYLVFLHEGLGCTAMWKDFPRSLCQATGCPGLVYDRLGYGASPALTQPRTLHYLHRYALDELPRLIASLIDGARAVDMPDADREAFLQELLSAHGAVIDQAKRWQVGQPDPRSPAMRLRSDGTVRFARLSRDSASDPVTVAAGESVLGRFERGDHIELITDAGEPAVYKLAWISPARKLFILSRYPKDTLSLSAAQLAALVFNERARRIDGPRAVDDAIGVLARKAGDRPDPSRGLPG